MRGKIQLGRSTKLQIKPWSAMGALKNFTATIRVAGNWVPTSECLVSPGQQNVVRRRTFRHSTSQGSATLDHL